MNTNLLVISAPLSNCISSTPRLNARRTMGASLWSVVIWVISAKFFTNPQAWTQNSKKLTPAYCFHFQLVYLYVHVIVAVYLFKSDCIIQYPQNLSCVWLCMWMSVCIYFFSVPLLSVLRGHPFFHPRHNGQ